MTFLNWGINYEAFKEDEKHGKMRIKNITTENDADLLLKNVHFGMNMTSDMKYQ